MIGEEIVPRILYVLPASSPARFHKRVRAMTALGFEATVLAFERDYYAGKSWPRGYVSLGHVRHRHYLRRLRALFGAIPVIRRNARKARVIYAFGMDSLLITWIASRLRGYKTLLVYEIADIREIMLRNSLVSRVLRCLERFLLRRIDLLVVTSEAFVTGYFRGVQRMKNIHCQIIENKVDSFSPRLLQEECSSVKSNQYITIGYFGLLRCRRSWDILRELVGEARGSFRVFLRGIFMGHDDIEAKSTEFVEYGGPYVSPDDLSEMYASVDIVWACYPYGGNTVGNWMWARTNRFYESCFFKKPMIAQKGNEDGRIVDEYELGLSIDLSDVDSAVAVLLAIKAEDLKRWETNLNALPKEMYTYSDEHAKLASFLKGEPF